jgi:hypothetical protein
MLPGDATRGFLMLKITGFLILLFLSAVLAVAVRSALFASLRKLLGRTVRVEGGAEFFARAFSLIVLFAALGPALGTSFDLKADARWMEGAWVVASGFGGVIVSLLMSLGAYLAVITVLLAALKPKDDSEK